MDHNIDDATAQWFRVVGFGLGGSSARTRLGVRNSYRRAGQRAYGYDRSHRGTSVAAHSATLVAGTTRAAVQSADISQTAARPTAQRRDWRGFLRRGNATPGSATASRATAA